MTWNDKATLLQAAINEAQNIPELRRAMTSLLDLMREHRHVVSFRVDQDKAYTYAQTDEPS